VHLEDEPGSRALVPQPLVDAHHGDLDQVGGRALEGVLMAARSALARGPRARALHVGQITAAAEDGAHVAGLAHFLDGGVEEALHAGMDAEILADEAPPPRPA
jgi:hypothetical protein